MRALTEHIRWRLAALIVACLLWYFLAGETEVGASVPITVQYRNIPRDLEITGEHLERLYVNVRGPQPRVSPAALAGLSLEVDMASVHGPGEKSFSISEKELGLPAGVRLIRAVPSQLRLSLQRTATRKAPVQVRYASGPPVGYRVASERVYPDSVEVAGPASKLQQLKFVVTDPLDISATVGSGEFRVPVYADDPELRVQTTKFVHISVILAKIL
ncbi:MAG: YbbR-like domain-containing protein [Bryobacteraceae bacterium]|nr:YbbR-like domain-containing protein [Bryobacteraceae bacterium]